MPCASPINSCLALTILASRPWISPTDDYGRAQRPEWYFGQIYPGDSEVISMAVQISGLKLGSAENHIATATPPVIFKIFESLGAIPWWNKYAYWRMTISRCEP